MEFDEIIVKESPGLCRCCLSEGCYKDLGSEYTWMNETEVYADMLLECFDIGISQHNDGPNGPNRLICEVCITRLRDACNFKKQVLDSEKKFVDMVGRGEFRPKVMVYQAMMKAETLPEEALVEDGEVEYLDEIFEEEPLKSDDVAPEASVSDDISLAALAKGKRGRPKKNSVKSEKKVKVAKLDDKPKTSRTVTRDSIRDNTKTDFNREQRTALSLILENSTAMPFRWFSNKFLCFYCCCEFVDSAKLKEHTYTEHQDAKLKNLIKSYARSRVKLDVSNIACKKCPKPIESLDNFLSHASEAHGLKTECADSGFIYPFKLSDNGMNCVDCGQSFRFFGPLLRHAHKYHNRMSPYLCEICGQGFVAKAHVDSHNRYVHSATSCPCKQCGDVFPSAYSLKAHREKVHKSDKLKCPKCPEILKSRYLKKTHLALVHDVKTEQFPCDECPKIFTQKNRLFNHKLRIHLKQKSVTCEICGFKVFNKDYLKSHIVKHNDERPFECQYCKKTFQRKKTLQLHVRIHTGDRRYVCKDCGKAFVQVTSLKSHIRSHHAQLPSVEEVAELQ